LAKRRKRERHKEKERVKFIERVRERGTEREKE
jgi:hypothetical protein